MALDDNRYVADILYEMKNSKSRDSQSRVLFKKRMFRETDETITEPQFVNLSYVQARPSPPPQLKPWLGFGVDIIQTGSCTTMLAPPTDRVEGVETSQRQIR